MHRVALGLKLNALKFARQKTRRPLPRRDRLRAGLALRGQHDVARQIVGLRAQSVEQPRTHAGAALDDGAGVHERVGRVVIDLLRVHRADDADVVRQLRDVREETGNLLARLAVFLEVHERSARFQFRVLQLRELLPLGERFGERLAVQLLQLRLPVKCLQVRGPARHAEMNDALGLLRKMERMNHAARLQLAGQRFDRPGDGRVEQGCQCDAAQTVGGA